MSGQTRKLHYKEIRDFAAEHVGRKGDIWYDPNTTTLRFYNGDPGGTLAGGDSYSATDFIDYGQLPTNQNRAIDLTYKYHWIVDLQSNSYHYTLADGAEGQVLEFYAAAGLSGDDKSEVWINNVGVWDTNLGSYRIYGRIVRVFGSDQTNTLCTKVTARFLNGAWHFDAPLYDVGGLP